MENELSEEVKEELNDIEKISTILESLQDHNAHVEYLPNRQERRARKFSYRRKGRSG